MKQLLRKLKSERGASILLALLFFLICGMVSSSILMASVSNAGKIKSEEKEEQAYLAVSSALQLVCDDLANSQYYGQYIYQENSMASGGVEKVYKQCKGSYDGKLGDILLDDFDALFREQMISDVGEMQAKDSSIQFESEVSTVKQEEHELKVTPQTGTDMDDYVVNITLQVDSASYSIYLTGELADGSEIYVMKAELTATGTKPYLNKESTPSGQNVTLQSESGMSWKVGWVTKAGDE
jgi:hypothetical protein